MQIRTGLNTAEERLFKWLKRKTTPPDAWKQMSIKELAAKMQCSTSQLSRSLPRTIARLEGMSLAAAEKLVGNVLRVRQGRLLGFEIEIIHELRSLTNPPSYESIAQTFAVSERRVLTICRHHGKAGVSGYYHSPEDVLALVESDHITELHENIRIRTQRRQAIEAKASRIRHKEMKKMLSHIRI